MVDTKSQGLKLVEYNTIASSMGNLQSRISEIHRYLADKYGHQFESNYPLEQQYNYARNDPDLSKMKMHTHGYDQRKELGNKCAKAVDLFIQSLKERFPDSE